MSSVGIPINMCNVSRTSGVKCKVSEYLSICAQCVFVVNKNLAVISRLVNPTNLHLVTVTLLRIVRYTDLDNVF